MSTFTHPLPRAVPATVRHLAWFAAICGVAFLVPYLGVSVLDLQHDVFYLAYFAVTIVLVGAYARLERVDVAGIFRRDWRWSVAEMSAIVELGQRRLHRSVAAVDREHLRAHLGDRLHRLTDLVGVLDLVVEDVRVIRAIGTDPR